jgi:hypothetical protein
MGFSSGSREVGEDVTEICAVSENGVRIRNTGDVTVYIGGPDVGNEGDTQGYPVEPGGSEDFTGAKAKESPIVPAPEGDMDPAVLYGRTAPGSGAGRVSFISVSMT